MAGQILKVPPIKSPLRYPGGKSKAVKQILPLIPEFEEYREPFVGGGSVFFAIKQLRSDRKFWINDISTPLYRFLKYCKDKSNELVVEIKRIRTRSASGKNLYLKLTKKGGALSEFESAVRFFILNRITFSGLIESGGYTEQAFKKRFTNSAIERLISASEILNRTKITNEDYEEVVCAKGKNVFMFLDPPYFSNKDSALYGKNGDLHKKFDHEKFANTMKKCQHKWLITYDDCPEVRQLFSFAPHIKKWQLKYGMNNSNGHKTTRGNELFISNYKL